MGVKYTRTGFCNLGLDRLVQWVVGLTPHWMYVSRESERQHRLPLIHWARNFTLIA